MVTTFAPCGLIRELLMRFCHSGSSRATFAAAIWVPSRVTWKPGSPRCRSSVAITPRSSGKKLIARIEKQHGTGKALSIVAHKIGRAVFYMLSRGTVFSMEKFLAASRGRERVSQTPHSSHVSTELVADRHPACAAERHEPTIRSQWSRQRARVMGCPLSPPTRTRVHGMGCSSPEPGDHGRAHATSLVMRRPA